MRLVRVAAAAAAVVAVLAGCSDGETANETLPSTSSTAAQTSASLPPLGPADMPMPAEAREQTPAGAESFLRYYMNLYTAAQASMDATYLDQLSQGCELCDGIIKNLKDDAAAGYKYEGGQVTVSSASFGTVKSSTIEGAFSVDQAPLTVYDANGAALADLGAQAESLTCGAVFAWSSNEASWIFTQWDVN